MQMTRFSAAMMAAFAMACGGGGKKAPDTTATPMEGTAPTDTATVASTEKPVEKPVEKPAEPAPPPPPPRKVMISMTPEELKWIPLVAEAGDKGPMVAALWGDWQAEANGTFVKLPAGDKGMMHTHTNDYHAIGMTPMTGLSDGGKAHPLAHGSYWFGPANIPHMNACPGKKPCILFAHFNAGKFDIAPAKPVKGAKPDPKHVEKPLKAAKWTPFDDKNPKGPAWSPLWGDSKTEASGMYVKVPAGNAPFWQIQKADYHAVVLAGTLNNIESGSEAKDLPVGSYYMQPGGNKHTTNCKAGGPDCILYVYLTGPHEMKPADDGKAGGLK